jgi:drug/metabolite transporter (DMT)-like permease
VAGLTLVAVGLLIAAWAADLTDPLAVVAAGAVLGAGYGFCLVAGLLEVQRIASPDELAGLNAVFYALTYVGFAYPIALAELSRFTSFTVLLLCLAGVVVVCLAVVASYSRKPLRHE